MKKLIGVLALMAATPAMADPAAFSKGPVFEDFGPVADVPDADFKVPKGTEFKIIYDTSEGAEAGELNNTLVAAARFMNMNARAGVPVKNMKLVITLHGPAMFDIINAERYAKEKGEGAVNPNEALVAALLEKGVRIIACGQSSAMRDVPKSDLLPGVEMSLSAMVVHGVLQGQGYTLNPF